MNTTITRLVLADDEQSAKEKFNNYFESKSSDYEVSYYMTLTKVLETII